MPTLRLLAAFLALAAAGAAHVGPPAKQAAPRPALSDPDDAALPVGAAARLGSTRLRNGGAIYDFAFSPDGKQLVTGGSGNNLRLWDVASGRMTFEFPGEEGRAHRVAFAPDGRSLFTAAGGRSVQVWILDGRKEVGRFEEVQDSISYLTVSPDGKTLATAHWADAPVRLWDTKTGKVTAELQGPKGAGGIGSLAFAPNGRLLVAVGHIRGAEIWEVASGRMRQKFDKFTHRFAQATAAEFTPDGKAVVVHARHAIHAWDLATEKQVRLFSAGKQLADGSLAVSRDGKYVASGDLEGGIRLWDWQAAKEVRRLTGEPDGGRRLSFSADGKHLASTGFSSNTLRLWDVAAGKLLHDPPGHRGAVESAAISPDGKRVVTCGAGDRTVRLWDRETAKELWRVDVGENHPPVRVAFSPEGKAVAYSTGAGQNPNFAAVLDAATGKELRRVGKERPPLRGLAFAPDGKALVTAGGAEVKFWDLESGRTLREAKAAKQTANFWDVAVSPDGKSAAVATFGSDVGLVRPGSDVIEVIGQHGGSVLSVAFTPDGRHVVSGAADSTARLWDVATKKEVQQFAGHGSHVRGVAVAPGGRLLATACLDRVVRLWDLTSGEELASLPGHGGHVHSVAFSGDGRHLVSGSGDCTALVWDVRRALNPDDGAARLDAKELERLWAELGDADAARAFKAMRALMQSPADVLAVIRERLAPVKIRAEVLRLLKEMDSPMFAAREKATAALEKMGQAVAADLRRALEGDLSGEVKGRVTRILERLAKDKPLPEGDRLRAARSVEILERLGTPQARAVLEALGRRDPESALAREARAALERLSRRPPP